MKFEKTHSVETFSKIHIRRTNDRLRVSVHESMEWGSTRTSVLIIREPDFGSPTHVRIVDPDHRLANAVREMSPNHAADHMIRVLRDAVADARPHPASNPDERSVWEDFLREIAPV